MNFLVIGFFGLWLILDSIYAYVDDRRFAWAPHTGAHRTMAFIFNICTLPALAPVLLELTWRKLTGTKPQA